ncbi:MAG: hypothetical protein ACP5GJ_02605 [Nanopusillaceae archaeon]
MSDKLNIFLIVLILSGFIIPILVYDIYVAHSNIVSCKFESNTVNVGSSINYLCYGVYNLTQGDNLFIIPLPGTGNIISSYISFINVQTPIVYVNLNGTVPPNSQNVLQLYIPSNAYNINIYGVLQGISSNNQYPFNSSITGGNFPLYCSPSCIYNQGLIINQSGSYQLIVNSGYGGGGVNYKIYGSYNLPNPIYRIFVGGLEIFSGQISDTRTIPIPINKSSTVSINVDGYPNAQVLFYIEQKCSLTGGFWNCSASVDPLNSSRSLIVCTTNVQSTCSLSNINIEIPFNVEYSKYLRDAENIEISVNGVRVNADTRGLYNLVPYFVIYNINQGDNLVQISYRVPYIIPKAQVQTGVCLIYPPSITVYKLSTQLPVNTTISIKNTGNVPIQVSIYPSSIKANVYPSDTVIQPGSTVDILVSIEEGNNGYIIIEGCSATPYKLPVSVEYMSSIVSPLIMIIGLLVLIGLIVVRKV